MLVNNKKTILLLSSILTLPIMALVFQFTTGRWGIQSGYFAGFFFYWIYLLLFIVFISKGQKKYFHTLFQLMPIRGTKLVYALLAFLPLIGVFTIKFLPNLPDLTLRIAWLALINAIINGLLEEAYWRGLYWHEYRHHTFIGIGLSTFLFGSWHIALYLIKGIDYGGFWPLVGGAAMMGLIWSICSRKLNGIGLISLAHVLINAFAFTGLYLENGF